MGYGIHSIGPAECEGVSVYVACMYVHDIVLPGGQFNPGEFFYGRIFDLVSGAMADPSTTHAHLSRTHP